MLPLEGVRVVDLTQAEFGPRAAMVLADMGADVIKIEPRQGEYTRPITRDYDKKGINCYFLAHNRNKRGIALDFQKQKGKEVIYKLVERSDVFMTTYAPGTMERHGLGYDVLRQHNPRLIYCQGSGFGPRGPMSQRRGYDLAIQGWTGLIHQTGVAGGPATPTGSALIDQCGGLAMAYGIMVALFVRERTGEGQQIDCSLLQTAVYCLSLEYVCHMLSGKQLPQSGRGHAMVKGLYHTFPAKDRWIAVAGLRNEPWAELCKVMGIEHLRDDPRFATTDDREEHRGELVPILDEVFRTKTAQEWVEKLNEIGVIVSPVNTPAEALGHPLLREQMDANEYLVDVEVPVLGKVKVTGPVVHLRKTPGRVHRPGFTIGEHTHEVLLKLGYTWEEIAEMIAEEVT